MTVQHNTVSFFGKFCPKIINNKLIFGLHIPTRTVSCPVTTRTVSKKFPGNFLKFPKKLRALLPLAHYRKGNFPRFVYYFRLFCSMNSILIKYSYNCNKINMAKFTL